MSLSFNEKSSRSDTVHTCLGCCYSSHLFIQIRENRKLLIFNFYYRL